METLDAHVFDEVLRHLKVTPAEACRLAVVSKTIRALVKQSSLCSWKDWCERACPSLKTSPAKELVSAHDEYMELFSKLATLSKERGVLKTRDYRCELAGAHNEILNLSDFIMLMDIYVEGKGIVFCSAEGTELDPSVKGFQEEEDFERYKDGYRCRAVVQAVCEPDGRET